MRISPLPAFEDNYIWLVDDCEHAAVVDPGEAAPVIDALERHRLRLTAILLTHHHRDHTGGAKALAERYPVPVYGPQGGHIPAVDHPLAGGESLDLGPLGSWQVLATPGHTLDHLAYYNADHGALCCGDTLFGAGCGKLFEGTAEQMQRSLALIRALPDDTLIYCGHEYTEDNLRFAALAEPGNDAIRARIAQARQMRASNRPTVPSTLALEKATNPFLCWDSPELVRHVGARLGHLPADAAEMFAATRAWKDAFDANLA